MHIFVFLVWLKIIGSPTDLPSTPNAPPAVVHHVSVESTELNGMAGQVSDCQNLTIAEASKQSPDFAENVAKGLTPKIVCGIAAPEPAPPSDAPSDGPNDSDGPDAHSNPGHGDWDHNPSSGL